MLTQTATHSSSIRGRTPRSATNWRILDIVGWNFELRNKRSEDMVAHFGHIARLPNGNPLGRIGVDDRTAETAASWRSQEGVTAVLKSESAGRFDICTHQWAAIRRGTGKRIEPELGVLPGRGPDRIDVSLLAARTGPG
jgi:hypothetical protein